MTGVGEPAPYLKNWCKEKIRRGNMRQTFEDMLGMSHKRSVGEKYQLTSY